MAGLPEFALKSRNINLYLEKKKIYVAVCIVYMHYVIVTKIQCVFPLSLEELMSGTA